MALLKDGRLAGDPWTPVGDDQTLDDIAQPVVTLERWQSEADDLRTRNRPLGIRLQSSQSPVAIADDLDRFGVIALEFPKFNDGRSFSHARLLRERYGYVGEVRAIGHVIRDQYAFLARCGFDAVEVTDAQAVRDWDDALGEIEVVYQPTGDGRVTAIEGRRAGGQ